MAGLVKTIVMTEVGRLGQSTLEFGLQVEGLHLVAGGVVGGREGPAVGPGACVTTTGMLGWNSATGAHQDGQRLCWSLRADHAQHCIAPDQSHGMDVPTVDVGGCTHDRTCTTVTVYVVITSNALSHPAYHLQVHLFTTKETLLTSRDNSWTLVGCVSPTQRCRLCPEP
jgi:hypothetical protein